jgi:hypothetical protein
MPPSQVPYMNNTVELRAQDEPLLRCRTLDLHLNVGANLPYLQGIYKPLRAVRAGPQHIVAG